MEKQPKEMTVCKLECLLMPQGEIICKGKTIGWFKNFKPYLITSASYDALVEALNQVLCDACDEIPLYLLTENGKKAEQAIKQAESEV